MTDPTGLDYHAAYRVLYPGSVAAGLRIQDLNDQSLRMVDRGAQIRRTERERVKDKFLLLAEQISVRNEPLDPAVVADLIIETAEEIR
jgi:hypothetical protein